MSKRILIFYLTKGTGHHAAALAVRQGLLGIDPSLEIAEYDSFTYGNPLLAKIVLKTYFGVLKTTPGLWEWMYDNPKFKERTTGIRKRLNRKNAERLETLLRQFRPDTIVCTQGFPCGVMADYKMRTGATFPLVGVLTDFVAHRYWAHGRVDLYCVPTEVTGNALVSGGVSPEKVLVTGIPVDPVYQHEVDRRRLCEQLGLQGGTIKVLIMGGSHGMGPMGTILKRMNKIRHPLELMIVTGINERLHKRLRDMQPRLRHPTHVFGFVKNIPDLMSVTDLLVTKPGGLTTSEALCKRLPMVICKPIPGQEMRNTEFLLDSQVAVKAETVYDLPPIIEHLLNRPEKLAAMRARCEALRRPNSAHDIAEAILRLTR
jgi:processive 1,2-diacylglycerol beta-glucosyltransferase